MAFKDFTGMKFERLTVLYKDETKQRTYWVCQCDCGNIKSIRQDSLHDGSIKSCGCLLKESVRDRTSTHKLSLSKEYNSWKHMKQRCHNPNASGYENYGGRGISVCNEWRNSFEKFYEDMGKSPSGYLLDRIDNDGNYSADNCRWVNKQQSNWNVGSRVGSSIYKGVHFSKNKNRWISVIWLNYKPIYIGSFIEEKDAALAYNKMASKLFGEHACLNKIMEDDK